MAMEYTDEFRRDALRIAICGLTRLQIASDLNVGLFGAENVGSKASAE